LQFVIDKDLPSVGTDLGDQFHKDLDAPPADRARFGIRVVVEDAALLIEGHQLLLPAMLPPQHVAGSIRRYLVLPCEPVHRIHARATEPNLQQRFLDRVVGVRRGEPEPRGKAPEATGADSDVPNVHGY
jgi:hypothetical protein